MNYISDLEVKLTHANLTCYKSTHSPNLKGNMRNNYIKGSHVVWYLANSKFKPKI